MALPKLSSGSGGGSIETETTSSSDDYNDTIDLGHSAASGGSQKFDLENNAAAAVETSDDIVDAGGPGTVLATTDEQVTEINKAVSDVSGQLRDMQAEQDDASATTTDVPQEVTAARNAASATLGQNGPVGPQGAQGGPFAALFAVVSAVLSAVVGLFGGT